MKTISAGDAKNNFGELMDTVQREPVSIEKYGRPVAVMISEKEFEDMKLENLRVSLAESVRLADEGEFSPMTTEELFADINQEFETSN